MRNRGRKKKKYEKKGKEKLREKKRGKMMKKGMTGPIMQNTESTIGLEKETLLMMDLIQILLLNSNGWRSETKRK